MKTNRFLHLVPTAVQRWAALIPCATVIIALAVGYHVGQPDTPWKTMTIFGGAGLLAGIAIALWLLSLGYVYADAHRRGMRPILWTLVAALLPHLLGFLLYFVLRQPIASICTHCAMTVAQKQRFCPWCGQAHTPAPTNQVAATS